MLKVATAAAASHAAMQSAAAPAATASSSKAGERQHGSDASLPRRRSPMCALPPVTPTTSEHQRALIARVKAAAASQSLAATPSLLALLDGDGFRRALAKSFPSLKQAKPDELLRWLEAQVRVSELTHGLMLPDSMQRLHVTNSSGQLLSEWEVRARRQQR